MKKLISISMLLTVLACSEGKGGSENKDSPRSAPIVETETSTPPTPAPAGTKPADSGETAVKPIELSQPPLEIPAATKGTFALAFDAKVNGEALKCYDKSSEMLAEGQVFTDLRMFISNLTFVSDLGEEIKLSLDVASNSANLQFIDKAANSIALLNFLDPGCAASDATKILKNAINGVLPYGNYTAVKFQVGLPYPAMDSALALIPAALAPTDMAWMWEHFPADFQLETHDGSARKILNALTSATKTTVTLPVAFTHASDTVAPSVQLELSKLFATSAAEFVKGIEKTCNNGDKAMTEASPNCAHAFKALGLTVRDPKAPYEQSVFTIAP